MLSKRGGGGGGGGGDDRSGGCRPEVTAVEVTAKTSYLSDESY